jgi:hypothetical protein
MKTRICLSLIAILMASCSYYLPVTTKQPTPMTPIKLKNLPTTARMRCWDDPNMNPSGIYLWELPALAPSDPQSNPSSNRGKIMGKLSPCAEIQILQFSWSETEQAFLVLVIAHDIKGWVSFDLIDTTK